MRQHNTIPNNQKSASGKTKFDKSSVVKVEDGKEWLASKAFEKTPVQKRESTDFIDSLSSKLHGTVQSRKQWLSSAFAEGGAKSDSFDSSQQWEAVESRIAQLPQRSDLENTSGSDTSASEESNLGCSKSFSNNLSCDSLGGCEDVGVEPKVDGDSSHSQQGSSVSDGSELVDEFTSRASELTTSHYSQERVFVVVLQAALRGFLVRRQMQRRDEAARTIQLMVRRAQAQFMCDLKIFAVILLQAWIRGYAVRKQQERLHATVALQSVARGWLLRSRLERTFAVVVAQSAVRGWQTRKRIRENRSKIPWHHRQASIIQAKWRRYQAQSMYELQKFAIVFLQSTIRGWLVRRRAEKSRAAVLLQSVFRMWRIHELHASAFRLEQEHRSSILIQTHWRRYQAQSFFELQSFAVVLLQSVFRVFLVQKRLEKMYASAFIQSLVRGWLVRRRLEQTFAVSLMQSAFRGWLVRHRLKVQMGEESSIEECLQSRETSIILIQSHWRRFQAQSMYELQSLAVVIIQSVVRVFLVQKTLEKTYAAALLQSVTRGWLVRRYFERTFAVAFIQSLVRGWLARKELRGLKQQQCLNAEYHRQREESAIQIQSSWRKYKAVSFYASRLRAIVTLQSVVRVFLVQKQLEKTYAAALLQAVIRGWLERKQMGQRVAAASEANRQDDSVLVMQRQWRRFRAQFMYELKIFALIFLQSVIRGFQARMFTRSLHRAFRARHAGVIQKWTRSRLRRREERRSAAAILIQAAWRGSVEKEAYEFFKLLAVSVIVIQNAWRQYKIKKTRNRRSLHSLSPNRGHHYVRRQFLFNSSYSLESVTPSSPSSVTVFTSGEYSAVLTTSEISSSQRLEARPALVVPTRKRKQEPVRITLDLSNPKTRLAPILTWFGAGKGSLISLVTSQKEAAVRTIQRKWRASKDRLHCHEKLAAIKVIQEFARKYRRGVNMSSVNVQTGSQNPLQGVRETCRSPSRVVVQLRRRSCLQSVRAPVLTWF